MLTVVVPCCDERANVPRFASELLPHLEAGDEVVAVDDGSTDGTAEALAALGPRVRVVRHGKNRGLGAALRSGFAAASGDWIATLDADLTFHPRLLRALVERQRATGADLVGASPFLEPGSLAEVPWRRRLPSYMVNAFYRGLLDRRFTSYTQLFRLYRASALRRLELLSDGFEANAELAARFLRAGLRLEEVPASLTRRVAGTSKLVAARELARHARLALRLLAERTPR